MSNAVYECEWEDIYDIPLRKSMHIVMVRAAEPQTLTVVKFITVSMQSFTSVRIIILLFCFWTEIIHQFATDFRS